MLLDRSRTASYGESIKVVMVIMGIVVDLIRSALAIILPALLDLVVSSYSLRYARSIGLGPIRMCGQVSIYNGFSLLLFFVF